MLPHMPFPNGRRLAKLRHAGSMFKFGRTFPHRCNHFFFGHGFLHRAFSNKKATRQGGSDSEFLVGLGSWSAGPRRRSLKLVEFFEIEFEECC
jgi:hypothetical protein